MTGRRMSAAEAHRYGLVNRVVPKPRLMEEARALAAQVAGAAPLAIMAAKAAMQATEALTVEEGYRKLRARTVPEYDRMKDSEDAWEGPRAFAEKAAAGLEGTLSRSEGDEMAKRKAKAVAIKARRICRRSIARSSRRGPSAPGRK